MCVPLLVAGAGVAAGAAVTVASGGSAAPAGIGIAGAGISAGAAIAGADAGSDAASRQAALDQQNAQLADQQAQFAVRDALVKVQRLGDQAVRTEGEQQGAYAAGNIDVTSGSAAAAQEGTAQVSQHLIDLAKLEGARTAYGYRTQGLQYREAAAGQQATASDLEEAGYLSAAGNLLAGASKTAGNWWNTTPKPPGGP